MQKKSFKPYIYFPILFALMMVVGIYIGLHIGGGEQSAKTIFQTLPSKNNKLTQLLNYIDAEYVDTVNIDQLTEKAIVELLKNLDPHSSYIPAEDLQALNEPLEGNFEGIGIEFNIIQDTIVVIAPISGGPSERLGIQPGDRIVKVEGENVAGIGIDNKTVIETLRGEEGTKVKVHIFRRGEEELIPFTITRGKIPINSMDVAYMLSDEIGYIKISRFSATTHEEYLKAFEQLEAKGMEKLVLDLRGNPGGYLKAAIDLADEFLEKDKLVVYTQGKARPKRTYYSTRKGDFEGNDLIVLIDEGSASASEIVAGAVQDNDRGLIIGRRSFGKGLVQEQVELSDGSALRLTIARYYTPTGRCIQKPYKGGADEYFHEYLDRYETGEIYEEDSVKLNDSLKYETPGGKIVYGGGGIMPDIFVPADTTNNSDYLSALFRKNLINQYAFDYADQHRETLSKYKNAETLATQFNISKRILNDFTAYAEKNEVAKDESGLQTSRPFIKNQLKAIIARHIFGDEGFYRIRHQADPALNKALDLMESGEPLISLRGGVE